MHRVIAFAEIVLGLTFVAILNGCSGSYSLREAVIRGGIPEGYKSYAGGIIKEPTRADIQAAIDFGKSSKEEHALEYAYLVKSARNALAHDEIYAKIYTPLFLVANHAREQARDYRSIDSAFVAYAVRLNAVKLDVTQQFISTVTYNAYAFGRQVILLRDGVRVEPLHAIASWQGQNPFRSQLEKKVQSAIAQQMQSSLSREQKISLIRSYRAMGYSGGQILAATNLRQEEITELVPGISFEEQQIGISESDAIYSIDELNKPGTYEIVFRTPPSNNLLSSGDEEVKFSVSFKSFK